MKLTADAEKLWAEVPKEVRTKILNNVFCGKCLGAVGIGNANGHVERGDLILKGICTSCGGPVARLIELSERNK
jgi:hypothetical protein